MAHRPAALTRGATPPRIPAAPIDDLIDRPGAGTKLCGMIDDYLQPIAQHVDHPERLLLRAADGRWYVWSGDRPEAKPEEVSARTAAWLLIQPGLRLLPAPHVWLHPADLPALPLNAWSARVDAAPEDAAAE